MAGETVTTGVVGCGKLDSTGVVGVSCCRPAIGAGDDFLGNTLLVSPLGVGDLRCFPEAGGGTSANEAPSACSPVAAFD